MSISARTTRRVVVVTVVLFAISIVALLVWFILLPGLSVARYERAYQSIGKGASVQEVISAMGEPTSVGGPPAPYWDSEELRPAEVKRIVKSVDYAVDSFALPVVFRFSFDEEGVLVGKHKYD